MFHWNLVQFVSAADCIVVIHRALEFQFYQESMPHGGVFLLVFGVYPEMFQQTDMSNLKMHKSDEYIVVYEYRHTHTCNTDGLCKKNHCYSS